MKKPAQESDLTLKKIRTHKDGKPKTDIEMLLSASFGEGDPWAQLLAALAAECFSPLPKGKSLKAAALWLGKCNKLKTLILETVWEAFAKRDGQLFRELGNALDVQKRNPLGQEPLPAALLAGKIMGHRPPPISEINAAMKSVGLSLMSDTHLKRIQRALDVQPQGGKPGHPKTKGPEVPPRLASDL